MNDFDDVCDDIDRYWEEFVMKAKAFGWGFAIGTIVTAIYTVIKK